MAGVSFILGLAFNASAAESGITDKLLTHLLNQQLNKPLVEVDGIPWPAGTYGIRISPAGAASIDSIASSVEISLPLQTQINGKINQDLGFTKVEMDCKSNFNHIGKIKLTPTFSGQNVTFVSQVSLPIPPVNADCGGVTFPVQDALMQMVAANKTQWEKEINQALVEQFNQPAP